MGCEVSLLAVLLRCRDWRDKASKSTFAYYIIGRMLISFQSFPGLVPEPNCCAAHQPELHVCYQKSSLQSMLARRKGRRTKMLIEQCKACVTLCLFCWTCRIFSETLPVRKSRQYEVCDPCPSVLECLPQARDKKSVKEQTENWIISFVFDLLTVWQTNRKDVFLIMVEWDGLCFTAFDIHFPSK